MNREILIALLTSTVLATIITCIYNYVINNKNSISNNIVNERKLWRKEMKAITEELNSIEDIQDLKKNIAKIKVNINAYGYKNTNNYMQDGHLWDLINEFESEKSINEQIVCLYKISFTDMISALLKYDWERSKREIKGNLQIRGIIFTCVICTIIGNTSCIIYMNLLNKDSSITGMNISTFLLLMIVNCCFTVGVYCLICIIDKYIIEEIKIPKKQIKIIFSVIFTIVVIWAIIDNTFNIMPVINLVGEEYRIAINFQTASLIISGALTLEYIWKAFYDQWIYVKTIDEIRKKFAYEKALLK